MREQLLQLLEPVLQDLGYELVHLEFDGQGRGALLRIYIDHLDSESQTPVREVTLDDCERVSREVSALLDVSDPIPQAYRLEVSSPGLNRPLVKPEHFLRFAGDRVRITLQVPVGDQRRFAGVLDGCEEGVVWLRVDGERVALPLADIQKARLAPVFD